MKYRTERDKMKALITAYEKLERIDEGMKPLFGGLCRTGYFQEAIDIIAHLIEANAVFPEDMTDEDERIDFLYNTLDAKISVNTKSTILGA